MVLFLEFIYFLIFIFPHPEFISRIFLALIMSMTLFVVSSPTVIIRSICFNASDQNSIPNLSPISFCLSEKGYPLIKKFQSLLLNGQIVPVKTSLGDT